MADMLFKTRGNASPSGKARVYFCCHPDDFDRYFESVCEYIFNSHDCAVYYSDDMESAMDETDLESCNLFVAPVTFKLLSTPNRAMDDVRFAMDKHIPVLPLMMESGIDMLYSRPDKFGELQYLSPLSTDTTEVSFEEKLKKYLESVLVSDEMAKRVRAAFDAYIFLSYRKKDRKYANQLMRIIHDKPECRDIAIWYDEFLTPGESFRENIDKILADSKLFTLLVTPNLLEDHNFVMDNEYPAAVKSGIGILPAEMEDTDKSVLAEKYTNLPEIANPYDDEAFRNRLAETLTSIAIKSNDNDPEHNFLIGLAYLDGIDVEVNRERALQLITKAAEAELPEAMEKLYDMNLNGIGVKLDYYKATEWAEKLMNYHVEKIGIVNRATIASIKNVALCYNNIGKVSESVKLSEKAYHFSRKVFGDSAPDTLNSLSALAISNQSIGNYLKAIELGKKAYQLSTRFLGETHPTTLASLSLLVTFYSLNNNHSVAIELGEKAYHLNAQVLGETHPNTLMLLSLLASYYDSIDDYSKAIELGEKAYQLSTNVFGETHPNTLMLLSLLASYYDSIDDYSKAIESGKKAYQLNTQALGETHPNTLTSLSLLASYYASIHDYSKAIELGEKVYQFSTSTLDESHPIIQAALNNLAWYYTLVDNYPKAVELYEKAYQISIKKWGYEHSNTLELLNNLAKAYRLTDNCSKATELYKKAISSLNSSASMYEFLHNNDKTIELYDKAYRLAIDAFDENHPDILPALNNLAKAYRSNGNSSKAIDLYSKAYDINLKVYGENHPDTLKALADYITYSFNSDNQN